MTSQELKEVSKGCIVAGQIIDRVEVWQDQKIIYREDVPSCIKLTEVDLNRYAYLALELHKMRSEAK